MARRHREAMSNESENNRRRPCRLLQNCKIPSVVWFEDALKAYGVPTALFDLYILVPNIGIAADVLERNGWKPIPQQLGRIGNAMVDLTAHPQLCLSPPNAEHAGAQRTIHSQSLKQSEPVPPSRYELPTVVLLPASEWNFSFRKSPQSTAFLPSLHNLFDGLLDSMLDCADLDLRIHLNVQLAYLYGYVPDLQERAFAERLLFEHRQYHFDVLSGMSYGTMPFVMHQRKVRQALREGSRRLQECSATRDDENLFNQAVQARLLASMPPPRDGDAYSEGIE